jgi:hypothetical protein
MNYEDRKQRARMDDEGLKRRKRRVDIPEDYDNGDFGDDYDDKLMDEGQSNAFDDGNLS